MRTRRQYLEEVLTYLDAHMGTPYASNVHDMVVKGLCPEHKAALNHELPLGSAPSAQQTGDVLMRRAAGVSSIPARRVWEIDSSLRERFVAAYTHFVYAWVNPRRPDEAPAFKAKEEDSDDDALPN